MLHAFSAVSPYLKFNPKRVTIDNTIFKLHYRWTFIILIVATILVCSRQYFGEHIKCISDTVPVHVINTYCFFTSTFTVVRHLNNTALSNGAIFQPGIGPYEIYEEPIKRHAYYQWVPFLLFGQALCFYIPHFLWKTWEGGRIKALVYGLKMVSLSKYLKERSLKYGQLSMPCLEETECRIKDIRRSMIERMRLNNSWGAHMVFAELLNLLNLMLQIYWTNLFLGGAFYSLGAKVYAERWTEQMDALDIVFPKVTKCHFHKYGSSGSLQMHDTLCVMALNIINEKIYTILWFWYAFLFLFTLLGLVWRASTFLFYKNIKFTRISFYWAKPGKIDDHELTAVIKKCNFSNWTYLFFLRSNLSEFVFNKVIYHLSSEFPSEQRENVINAAKLSPKDDDLGPSRLQTLRIDEIGSPLLEEKGTNKLE
ncbi:innexin inx7 [Glossina fuscipes]|uniref:Innexin n=1 Tax=Glossina fuscipes TaxID=7396 RepID=A0A9C6DTA8_9MUSC|nr:innexin inx7 [Glossina fuscipes]